MKCPIFFCGYPIRADWSILDAGPDHEWYWESWTEVCDNAIVTDDKGIKYRIWQDGDCWLVPEGMEWSEENETYVWPTKEESDENIFAEYDPAD